MLPNSYSFPVYIVSRPTLYATTRFLENLHMHGTFEITDDISERTNHISNSRK